MADEETQQPKTEEKTEEEKEGEKDKLLKRIAKFIPAVEKPTYKESFNNRLMWTGIALVLYLVLSYITIFGVSAASYERFRFFEIVLGSRFGSLMTLGIGPIVTAGILLQLLVGSKIISWDMSKSETRSKFQTWSKLLAIILSFVEAAAYVLAGAIPVTGGLPILVAVILQLAAGGIIVILLDDLVSKWGFGSGVSLFIAAGVATQIIIGLISPLAAEGRIAGAIPAIIVQVMSGNFTDALMYLLPVISTAIVLLIVVYAQ